ncbi:hypothetical protein FDA94_31535 [Herbidospora galbida]|uniref:Tetratricopeptide repeat protein n=2 Tax=Herbidospora galbida TaxID=2575442 RepID=A0A4U3M6E3_9ACTN|nr:hypothetical protein FDA94_31535 [Herbidospora galbida]
MALLWARLEEEDSCYAVDPVDDLDANPFGFWGWRATEPMVDLLVGQQRVSEALEFLGCPPTATSRGGMQSAALLIGLGRVEEVLAYLRAAVEESAINKAREEALWGEAIPDWENTLYGDVDHDYDQTGNPAARLADVLAAHDRVDELADRARAGDKHAVKRLVDLLIRQGRVEEACAVLEPRADAGDHTRSQQLVDLLVEHDRIEELAARADAGDYYATVNSPPRPDRSRRESGYDDTGWPWAPF